MKKIVYIFLALCLLLSACTSRKSSSGSAEPVKGDEDLKFEEFAASELYDYLASDKLGAHYTVKDLSAYGLQDLEADLGDPGTLEDLNDYSMVHDTLDLLHKLDRSKLCAAYQNAYDRYESYLNRQLAYEGVAQYSFVFGVSSGVNTGLITNFTEFEIREEQDIRDIITYLQQSGPYLEKCIDVTKEQAAIGIEQSADTMEGIMEQVGRFMASKGNTEVETAMFSQIDDASYLSEEAKKAYKEQITEAVNTSLLPGYQAVYDYFDEARLTTTSTGRLGENEESRRYYQALLQDSISSSMAVPEAKELLQAHIDSLIKRLTQLFRRHGDDYPYDGIDYGYEKPEEILDHLREAMTEDFPEGPKVPYSVNYLDPSVTSESVAAYYLNPTVDDLNRNVIKVNPSTSSDLFTTLAHEGFPGHCYQITYEIDNLYTDLYPIMSFLGYTEGWAVYVESVAMKYGKEDNPYTLEMDWIETALFYEIMCAVDIMIHYENADVDAVSRYVGNYYSADFGQDLYDLSVGDPGSYLPYGLGYLLMDNVVKMATDELGDKADLKAIHKVILDAGSCDFEYLEARMKDYLASVKK